MKMVNIDTSAGSLQLQVNPGDTFEDLVGRASGVIGQDLHGSEIWTKDGKADSHSNAYERLNENDSVKMLPGVVVGD